MKLPTASELLDAWEAGLHQPLLDQALYLLQLAGAAPDLSSAAHLSIGERDACLLLLREWLFGQRLLNRATCPACAETVEWETDTPALHLQAPVPSDPARTFTCSQDEFVVGFRLPNSYDIRRALSTVAGQVDAQLLLRGCVLWAQQHAQPCPVGELPAAVWEALDERMAREDPQADIQMLVSCPACGQQWEAPFDIAGYLWCELDSWARRLLREVSTLAAAFGWPERAILNLSAQRRQFYLATLRA